MGMGNIPITYVFTGEPVSTRREQKPPPNQRSCISIIGESSDAFASPNCKAVEIKLNII